MIYDIILALFAVFGMYSAAKVIWHTVTVQIDRRRRKEYNKEDKL